MPRFERADGERLHDRLAAEMRAVYLASDEPAYLDERARVLLAEGREAFRSLELEKTNVLQEEKDVHVFLWRGSQVTAVFGAAAAMVGLPGHVHDLGLTLSETTVETARSTLASLADVASDAARVAGAVQNIAAGKFKDQVPGELAKSLWVRQNVADIDAIPKINLTQKLLFFGC